MQPYLRLMKAGYKTTTPRLSSKRSLNCPLRGDPYRVSHQP